MAGCLLVVVACIIGGLVGLLSFGSFESGTTASVPIAFAITAVVVWVSKRRHIRLIKQWADDNRLTLKKIERTRGFVTPPPLPWWRDWTAYDSWAVDDNRRYHFFLTGPLFVLFDITMNVTTDEDYIWYR